jgi:hypothetical protein
VRCGQTCYSLDVTIALGHITLSVYILVPWAFSKFRNSKALETAVWAGLVCCLAQDFIGIVAIFSFFLIATGAVIGLSLIVAGAFVLLVPPILGTWMGYRIGMRYSESNLATRRGKGRQATPAVVMVFLILVVQASLAAFLLILLVSAVSLSFLDCYRGNKGPLVLEIGEEKQGARSILKMLFRLHASVQAVSR